jgi:hypothetical protein
MRLGDGDYDPGLEEGCTRPGVWIIESYDVERIRRGLWQVRWRDELRYEGATLNDCREFIRVDRRR